MNQSEINSFDLNGPFVWGHNASLLGGIAIGNTLAGAYRIDAILSGGMENQPTSGGNISALLQGGIESVSDIHGKWFITIFLSNGIFSQGGLSSTLLGVADALRGGVESPSFWGGQIIAGANLKVADTVGDTNQVGGVQALGHILTGSLASYTQLNGNLIGSTVLVGGGIATSSLVGGALREGVKLQGSLASSSTVGGIRKNNAILSGGILAIHAVGKELDISARLQQGIMSVGSQNINPMRVSPRLQQGLMSTHTFNGKLILSPRRQGGINSLAMVGGGYKISSRLQGFLASGQSFNSNGLKASQRLQGNLKSSCSSNAGIRITARLQMGVYSDYHVLGGDIAQGFRDPLLNTWALELRSATILLEIFTPKEDT